MNFIKKIVFNCKFLIKNRYSYDALFFIFYLFMVSSTLLHSMLVNSFDLGGFAIVSFIYTGLLFFIKDFFYIKFYTRKECSKGLLFFKENNKKSEMYLVISEIEKALEKNRVSNDLHDKNFHKFMFETDDYFLGFEKIKDQYKISYFNKKNKEYKTINLYDVFLISCLNSVCKLWKYKNIHLSDKQFNKDQEVASLNSKIKTLQTELDEKKRELQQLDFNESDFTLKDNKKQKGYA